MIIMQVVRGSAIGLCTCIHPHMLCSNGTGKQIKQSTRTHLRCPGQTLDVVDRFRKAGRLPREDEAQLTSCSLQHCFPDYRALAWVLASEGIQVTVQNYV